MTQGFHRITAALALGLILAAGSARAEEAAPINIQITAANGKVTDSVYVPPKAAKKPWRIAILIPHLKDPYWLAASYGAMDESKRLGIKAELLAAQGYTDITGQLNQLDNVVAEGVNAIVLAPIGSHAEVQKVNQIIAKGIPVIDLINPLASEKVTAKRLVSYRVAANLAGQYLRRTVGAAKANVAVFPGPAGSGWAEDMLDGFKEAIHDRPNIKIIATKWGDTGKDVQMTLLQNVLQANPDVNYIVGNPVAASAAVNVLAQLGLSQKVKIISLIDSSPVVNYIKVGKIAMTPTDYTVQLGRLGIDAAVDKLDGRKIDFHTGTKLGEITNGNIGSFVWQSTFAPNGYSPVFKVNW
ncbi:MAG: TMAO reductase system periplasmic protein TorT [Stellaceae bacterium]